ncbi:GIY-YIG nuclease family protein [Paenibacillus oryzisoli]|uniref:GIY-YIG domain-containing protein n=1 Tax=Paenibacillus oryzisoli TaxID=1850517 RepID=A0A198AKC4_9BACL|nr:GIY-YIG nuclease family protein [Paenibacillus oryzisoli]OAS21373.1 hypothetical protein A8708_31390 [Paenibacillus oryzisoli]
MIVISKSGVVVQLFPRNRKTKKIKNHIGVYAIVNAVNNKVFIGSGELENRKATQWSLLNAGKHYNKRLQQEWNHFKAENFRFVTLFEAKTNEDLDFLQQCEEYWITYTMATDKKYGYNIYKKSSLSHEFRLKIQPI